MHLFINKKKIIFFLIKKKVLKPKKKMIKTTPMVFDVGWKRLQIYNFAALAKNMNVNDSSSLLISSAGDLNALRVHETYWDVDNNGMLQSRAVFVLNNQIYDLQVSPEWRLVEGYAIHISMHCPRQVEELLQLPHSLCLLITSYLAAEDCSQKTTPVRIIDVENQFNHLQLDVQVKDRTLEYHIEQALLYAFRPLIHIHELDKKTGFIHTWYITRIDFELVAITQKNLYHYCFNNGLQVPTTYRTILTEHNLRITKFMFNLNLKLFFNNDVECVNLTEIFQTTSFKHPYVNNGYIAFNRDAVCQFTALAIGVRGQLVTLGKVWHRDGVNDWTPYLRG